MQTPEHIPVEVDMSQTLDCAEPMPTVDIHYAGRTVALADLREYAKFYRKLAAGAWERATFETLARNLDRETVCVDIGAWIGVTPLWSAQSAKAVVAVEPDPKCVGILRRLSAGVENVTVIEGALSAEKQLAINAVDGFGSSETSALDIGNGERVTVPGIGIDQIFRHVGDGPVFVKIDIEGYEYSIAGEIAKLSERQLRGLQIAIHPQLYEKSLGGGRLSRRLRTAWATWRLGRRFARFIPGPRLAKFDSLAAYVLRGILFRKTPKGADFVYERNFAGSTL